MDLWYNLWRSLNAYDVKDIRKRAEKMMQARLLAQEDHRQQGAEGRHQVDEQPAGGSAYLGDGPVVEHVAEKGRKDPGVGDPCEKSGVRPDLRTAGQFPRYQGRQHHQPANCQKRISLAESFVDSQRPRSLFYLPDRNHLE